VIDGPFTETKELIAGFWLWRVKSKAEAIDWLKRCPNPFPGESEIEIRQVYEAEDFGVEFTPELREQEERLRANGRKDVVAVLTSPLLKQPGGLPIRGRSRKHPHGLRTQRLRPHL
jgi:hypothetical protein